MSTSSTFSDYINVIFHEFGGFLQSMEAGGREIRLTLA